MRKLNIFTYLKKFSAFLVVLLVIVTSGVNSPSFSNDNSPSAYISNIVDADGSLKRVIESGVLKVGADPNIGLPYIEKEGKNYKGFEVETAKFIAEELGCKLKIIPTNWNNLVKELEKNKFDIVLNAFERPEDKKELTQNIGFSDPYFDNSQYITVSSDNEDIRFLVNLKNKKVGVLTNSVGEILITELNKNKNTGITLITYSNLNDLFSSLQKKLIESIIIDAPIAGWYCSNPDNKCKLTGLPILPQSYVIAVKKSDRALLNGIDAIIRHGKETDKFKNILKNWNIE